MTLLLLTVLLSLIKLVESNECNKIYFAPVAPVEPNDLFDYSAQFVLFLTDCLMIKKKNTFITTLDFNFNTSFTCVPSAYDFECPSQYGENDIMSLNESQYYGIRNFIDQQIERDEECGNGSLTIFFSFISCANFSLYPDLNQLFGDGIEETQKYLQEKNLHYLLVLPFVERSDLDICNETIMNLNFTQTSNIKTFLYDVAFLEIYGRDACDVEIPVFPPGPDLSVQKVIKDKVKLAVSISCGVVSLLIVLFVGFWGIQIRKRYLESKIEAFANEHTKGARHILFGKYLDEWEVTPKELKVDQEKILGQGAFGTVYNGYLKKKRNEVMIEVNVAVKFPKINALKKEREEMIKEIGFMKALGNHENLLTMVGYVKSIDNPVICTVFCSNGDLLSVLRKHPLHFMSKEKCSAVEICLLLPDLLRISIEVCNGLIYLSSLNYVHRDIAARNILLDKNLIAKLSDFGLCRQLENGKDYLIEKDGKFPIKHMPLESITDGKFSEKSDVWSFGILVWEMFSGGEKPFDNLDVKDFIENLENEGKPEFIQDTPNQLLQILNDNCFQKDPSNRSTFIELKQKLNDFYYIVLSIVR